jgi:hypothetical protein
MPKANADIRQVAHAAGVKLWEIANVLDLNDGNFSRKLRYELPDAEKVKIRDIIARLVNEREEVAG